MRRHEQFLWKTKKEPFHLRKKSLCHGQYKPKYIHRDRDIRVRSKRKLENEMIFAVPIVHSTHGRKTTPTIYGVYSFGLQQPLHICTYTHKHFQLHYEGTWTQTKNASLNIHTIFVSLCWFRMLYFNLNLLCQTKGWRQTRQMVNLREKERYLEYKCVFEPKTKYNLKNFPFCKTL